MRRTWVALSALLLTMACLVHAADWMDGRKAGDMSPHPAPGSTTHQTPPDFRWPFRDETVRYDIQVADQAGATTTSVASYNWFNPDSVYQPGTYRWRVRAIKIGWKSLTGWSDWREFQVAEMRSLL